MKRLLSFSVLCFAMSIGSFAHSQVAPGAFENEQAPSGDGTALGAFSNSAQVVYNESVITGLNQGDVITGISFRLNSAGLTGFRQGPILSLIHI